MESNVASSVNRKTVVLVATMVAFLTPFMGSSVNVAIPTIGKEFAMDAVQLGWVAMSYLLAASVFLVPLGRIADIYGRKRVLIYGMIIFTASSLLVGISTSGSMLILFRVVQGIGGAFIFSTTAAILTSVFPIGERGKVLGLNVAAVYLGLSSGPFFGGLLTHHFGWRSIFLVVVPLGLLIVLLIFWKMKGEWTGAQGDKFDFIGSLVYGIAIVALLYGLSLLPATIGIWIITVGIFSTVGFIWWETKVKSPVLDMKLFRNNAVFAFSNLAALINYSATFAVAFLLSLYLQYVKGLSAQSAGFILVSMPAVQAVFSPIAGRLSDKIEPRILASIGMAFTTVGLSFLISLTTNTLIGFIVIILIILGFGFALFSSPNTNAVMSSVDKSCYGVASATLATMRQVGMTFSMGVAMLIIAVYVGKVEITPEYFPSFLMSVRTAFIIFACLCFIGIFASLARGTIKS
jgi:EmrB/QacA subfamily drug resistance transporter